MHFSTSSLLALSLLALSTFSLASASPIPCPDEIRDQVLRGILEPSACCNSYGTCKPDVNM
ncbi:hypothetical protein LARI1_G003254 [Lachnellula arida]|uniref:Uncharacterized protein n=2 Tax=Lachnellula TaxID=47830 RepID=A0A8T9BFZ4_9HELO|nr:hypothetical protein LARI1_G003254 [Lachnellula arida]TVY90626.1 hypothetical protein LAWI1_G005920 [Lachnellula willkommii]